MSSRFAIWGNDYKNQANQPDGKGHIEITCALVQELAAAMQAGQGMTQNQAGEWIFKLDAAAWRGNGQPRQPVFSGTVSTLAETNQRAAARAQRQQENGGGAQWGPPAQQAPPQYQPQAAPPAAPPQAAPAAAPPASAPPAPAAPAPAPAAAPAAPGGWGAPAPAGGGWGQAPGI